MKEFFVKNKNIVITASICLALGGGAAYLFVSKESAPAPVAVAKVAEPEVYIEPRGLYSCRADSDCVIVNTQEPCGCNNGGYGFMAINKDNKEYYEKFNPAPANGPDCPNTPSLFASCKVAPKVECWQEKCYIERGVDEILKAVSEANIPLFDHLVEQGVPLTVTDRDGRGLMFYAAINKGRESENLGTIQYLIKKEVPTGDSLFSELVRDNKMVTADFFLQNTNMPKTINIKTFLDLFDPKRNAAVKDLEEKQEFLFSNGFALPTLTEEQIEDLKTNNPIVMIYLEPQGATFRIDKEKKEKKEALAKIIQENPLKAIKQPDSDNQSFTYLVNIYEAAANEMPLELAKYYKSVIGYIIDPLTDRVRLNSSLSAKEKADFNAFAKTVRPIKSDKIFQYFDCRKPFFCWRKKVRLDETSYMWQPVCQNGCYYDILGETPPTPTADLVPINNLEEFNSWAQTNSIIGDY